jgi:hypothetical protein
MQDVFLHILRGKMCRKRTSTGRCVCKNMLPPGGESNHSVTPAPGHGDTSSNLSPEDFTADRRSLKSYKQQVKQKYLYPSLGENDSGEQWDRQEQEVKWEHTSPSQSSSGNKPD